MIQRGKFQYYKAKSADETGDESWQTSTDIKTTVIQFMLRVLYCPLTFLRLLCLLVFVFPQILTGIELCLL